MPKVFITKYALTKGIIAVDAEIVPSSDGSGLLYASTKRRDFSVFTREFERTEAEALATAETMRTRKIAALKRQISKLEKLKIAVEKK